jgi:hypothetical protein
VARALRAAARDKDARLREKAEKALGELRLNR